MKAGGVLSSTCVSRDISDTNFEPGFGPSRFLLDPSWVTPFFIDNTG